MPVYQLPEGLPFFPHPLNANRDGLLAIGGDLDASTLHMAYAHGIFPWYGEGQPVMWWFPRPRAILLPEDLRISKSLRATMRKDLFEVTLDMRFSDVILACARIRRKGQSGTWILPEMIESYIALHRQGLAHSVEVWQGQRLVGGLYGIWLGRIFFGESMFSRVPDASKVALVRLIEHLAARGLALVDCQQDTPHMRSMGSTLLSAERFYTHIRENQIAILEGQQSFR